MQLKSNLHSSISAMHLVWMYEYNWDYETTPDNTCDDFLLVYAAFFTFGFLASGLACIV